MAIASHVKKVAKMLADPVANFSNGVFFVYGPVNIWLLLGKEENEDR